MGIVYEANVKLIRPYVEEVKKIFGRDVKLAALSAEEVELIIKKVDGIVPSKLNPLVAEIVSAGMEDIITLVRMVNVETKQGFGGMTGTGRMLDINWMRAKDIGNLYGDPSTTYTWVRTETTIGLKHYIPDRILPEEEGHIYLGFIDPVTEPKVDAVQFIKAGIPLVPQTLNWNIRPGFGTEHLPVAKLERAFIVGPEQRYAVDNFWNKTGEDRLEPIAFVVKRAEVITLAE